MATHLFGLEHRLEGPGDFLVVFVVGRGDDGGGGGEVDGRADVDFKAFEKVEALLHGAAAAGLGNIDSALTIGV